MESFKLLGIKVHSLNVSELHERIMETIQKNQKLLVLNVNINAYFIAKKDSAFKDILNHAGIVFCDGLGVKLGARILGFHIIEKITYATWFPQLSKICEKNGFSMFLLGGKPGIAEEAAKKLIEKFPKLRIVGFHHGYFSKEGQENDIIVNEINQLQPDILLVSFGMPFQEKWIWTNCGRISAKVYLAGGACLDYASGRVPRAPTWILWLGMEWLFRFVLEPKRLWRRYIIGNTWFIMKLLKIRVWDGKHAHY